MNANPLRDVIVTVNSAHKNNVLSNSFVSFPLDVNLANSSEEELIQVEVIRFTYANSFYNIPEGKNNILVGVQTSDTTIHTKVITLPVGFYSAAQMAVMLSTLPSLQNIYDDGNVYGISSVTFDINRGMLVWTWLNAGAPLQYYIFHSMSAQEVLSTLGLTASSRPGIYVESLPLIVGNRVVQAYAPATPTFSPFMFDARRHTGIQVGLPNLPLNHYTSVPSESRNQSTNLQRYSYLFSFPVTVDFGETQQYEPAQPLISYINRSNISILDVEILDPVTQQPVEFLDQNWSLTLAFRVVRNPAIERPFLTTDQDTPLTLPQRFRQDPLFHIKRRRL